MISNLELLFFTIGGYFLLLWFFRFSVMLGRIFLGTQVTTARYGENSWAIVTGCTDGIGKGLSLELARRGFNIVLVARNSEKLAEVAKEIQNKHKRQTRVIIFDFSKECTLAAYESIAKRVGELDVSILVNNVGILIGLDDYKNTRIERV